MIHSVCEIRELPGSAPSELIELPEQVRLPCFNGVKPTGVSTHVTRWHWAGDGGCTLHRDGRVILEQGDLVLESSHLQLRGDRQGGHDNDKQKEDASNSEVVS